MSRESPLARTLGPHAVRHPVRPFLFRIARAPRPAAACCSLASSPLSTQQFSNIYLPMLSYRTESTYTGVSLHLFHFFLLQFFYTIASRSLDHGKIRRNHRFGGFRAITEATTLFCKKSLWHVVRRLNLETFDLWQNSVRSIVRELRGEKASGCCSARADGATDGEARSLARSLNCEYLENYGRWEDCSKRNVVLDSNAEHAWTIIFPSFRWFHMQV